MFTIARKFSSKIYRRPHSLGCRHLIRLHSNQLCKPIAPPPKKRGKFGALIALGTLTLATGGTLYRAKTDYEFRRALVTTVPFADDVLRFIFQEDRDECTPSIYESIIGSGDTKKKKKIEDKPKEYTAPSPIIPALEKDMKKEQDSYAEVRLEQKDQNDCTNVEIVGELKPKPSDKVSETDPAYLAELEEQICQCATEAINAYNKAIYNLKVYNIEIGRIIDNTIDCITPPVWESMRTKTREKNESIHCAKEKAEEAIESVRKLKTIILKPSFNIPPPSKEIIRLKLKSIQDDIDNAKKEFEREQRLATMAEQYWEKVEEARQHFSEELEILFPNVNLNKKEMKINSDELDLFLTYAYSRIQYYQKELVKMQTLTQERLANAVDSARRGGGEVLTNAQVCSAIEEEKQRITTCFQQQCLKLRREGEENLREQLKRQSQAFSDHLEEAIRTRTAEIERELSRKFDELLETEKTRYKVQLSAMVGRLKGLDHALQVKATADKTARQAQVLWSACQSLHRAIKTGCPGIPWKDQLRPLEPEIVSVQKAAAENDELVQAVINGIPKEAKERGVFPEDALRERFLKVEEVARTLALVPEGGASLPVYVLSYIQSLLLIKAASPIPRSELNDEEIDFTQLNTNEILQRARYWLDRGDFAQALKYMNLLKGAPRSVAKEWMDETRILLETQQAANTLMAHASSSGLMYL